MFYPADCGWYWNRPAYGQRFVFKIKSILFINFIQIVNDYIIFVNLHFDNIIVLCSTRQNDLFTHTHEKLSREKGILLI